MSSNKRHFLGDGIGVNIDKKLYQFIWSGWFFRDDLHAGTATWSRYWDLAEVLCVQKRNHLSLGWLFQSNEPKVQRLAPKFMFDNRCGLLYISLIVQKDWDRLVLVMLLPLQFPSG